MRFPLLIKIIDAKDDLSIQVHPDDIYAAEHEHGSFGKMECWYILDCKENSSLVIGHNAKTKEELCDMIENKKWKQFIREIPVKKVILSRSIREPCMQSKEALRFLRHSKTVTLHTGFMIMTV